MNVANHSFTLTTAERNRIEQIDLLVARGPGSVHELLECLSDPSWTVRRAAVSGLAAFGDDAVPSLCDWLADERTSEHAIAAAVDALAGSTGTTTNREVERLLGHASAAVAADAAHILGRRRAREASGALGRLLEHPDDNVAVAAIEAIEAIGGATAIDALIGVLPRKNFFRAFAAIQVLAKVGDLRAIGPLSDLLQDPVYRSEAIRALGRTGAVQAIAPLASVLPGAGSEDVRLLSLAFGDLLERGAWVGASSQLTSTLRSHVATSLPMFVVALQGADLAERTAIVGVLGDIGDLRVVAAITDLLEDPQLCTVAIKALQRIAVADPEVLEQALTRGSALVRAAVLPAVHARRSAASTRALLTDDDVEVRARACDALARIADTSAVAALFAALGDPSPRVAHAAASAIHSLGVTETGPLAMAALRSGTPTVRRQALRILGYIGYSPAFTDVRAAVSDTDPRIGELAVAALAMFDDIRVDDVFVELAQSANEVLRAAAVRGAALRPSATALRILERGLQDEAAWVRYYACQGLGRLGHSSASTLIIGRLTDAMPHVRIAAIEALAHLDTPVAWQALCSAARSSDPDEHRAALLGLSLTGQAAALPLLEDAVRSADLATRLIALTGLARSSHRTALTALTNAALRDVPDARDAALSLLAERDDRAAADVLVETALAAALDHPAHLALSRPGAARVAAIVAYTNDVDDRGATCLTAALARMRDTAAHAALFELLSSVNPAIRRAAAIALIATGVKGAVAAVQRLASEDPDLTVRRVCAAAIAG